MKGGGQGRSTGRRWGQKERQIALCIGTRLLPSTTPPSLALCARVSPFILFLSLSLSLSILSLSLSYHKTVVAVNALSARVTEGVPINNTHTHSLSLSVPRTSVSSSV